MTNVDEIKVIDAAYECGMCGCNDCTLYALIEGERMRFICMSCYMKVVKYG
jgi:uncharacterized ferredoxin-like protein